MIDIENVLLGLQIAVAIMVIVVLYHVVFIVVDTRKIVRRIEEMTAEVEDVLMKPLSMVDQLLSWAVEVVEKKKKKTEKK